MAAAVQCGRVRPAGVPRHYPDTTQDTDLFVEKSAENGKRLTRALRELGFALREGDETAIREGYDFVQLRNGPFPLDLIYAPLGIFQLIGGRPAGHAHRHDVSPCPPAPAASRTLRMTTANRRTSGIVAAFSTTYSTGCCAQAPVATTV